MPIPGNGAFLEAAWCFAFFGGTGCSGAMIVLLSAVSADAASTALEGSAAPDEEAVAAVEVVAAGSFVAGSLAEEPTGGAELVIAAPE